MIVIYRLLRFSVGNGCHWMIVEGTDGVLFTK
jgi:hypothetical protein